MSSSPADRRILDLPPDPSPARLDEAIACLADRYPALRVLPGAAPHFILGQGSPSACYLADRGVGSAALIRFAGEYSEQLARGGRLYGISIPYLAALRSIHVLPMQARPIPPATSGPTLTTAASPDAAVPTLPDAAICLHLHTGERRVLLSRFADRRTVTLGRVVGRLCGAPSGTSTGSSPVDEAAAAGIPAFSIGLGEGAGVFEAYASVRELLFLAPTLVGK